MFGHNKLARIGYSALVGTNLGFALALGLSQWTWLEMRANVGLIIPVGLLTGIFTGLFKNSQIKHRWGWLSLWILLFAALASAKGDLISMMIIMGAVFREGTSLTFLTLDTANIIIGCIALCTVIFSIVKRD